MYVNKENPPTLKNKTKHKHTHRFERNHTLKAPVLLLLLGKLKIKCSLLADGLEASVIWQKGGEEKMMMSDDDDDDDDDDDNNNE